MKTSCCHSRQYQMADHETMICRNPDCTEFLHPTTPLAETKTWNLLFMGCFFVFFFIFTFYDYSSIDNQAVLHHDLISIHSKTPKLTPENLRIEIHRLELLCPDEVYAQMLLESGYLNSFLTQKTNNLLGMRYPYKRKTTAIGLYLPDKQLVVLGDQKSLLKYRSENNYAVFANWKECVNDYKHWQDECFQLKDRYLNFLGKYYAEDVDYISKIKSMSKK